MAAISDVIARVRTELGDLDEEFVVPTSGGKAVVELGVRNVRSDSVQVSIITPPSSSAVVLDPAGYVIKERAGVLVFNEVPVVTATITITGNHFPMFSDEEVTRFVEDAVRQHCHEREITTRYRDELGHIRYERTPLTLANLPEIEIEPLTILATIEALWSATTDAATDIDVVTAEGTRLRREQRYRQMLQQIELLTERYKTFCTLLGIGMYRIEQRTLRRISPTTGRLVPIFRPREYDDYDYPQRVLPPIEVVDEDDSGLPSPILGGWGY